jgi:hypothetical protein
MRELDMARSRIRRHPEGDAERVLGRVIAALEANACLDMAAVYALDYDSFNLVIDIMRGWWLQRYTGVARNGVARGHGYIEKRNRSLEAQGASPALAASSPPST